MKEKSFLLFIFAICFNYVVSQISELKIGEIIEDTITNKKFYKAELTDRKSDYLIINLKPTDNYEKYSDPDIFVSSKNSYPSNFELAEWYSINKGEDMIPIQNSALENSTYISICVKCEGQCSFTLSVRYEDKVDLKEGVFYYLQMTNNYTTQIFQYNHTSTEKKFEILAMSGRADDMFIKVHYVYGFNTTRNYNPLQSFYNGYSVIVDTTDFFPCEKCYFRIEVTTKKNEIFMIGIGLKNVVNTLNYMDRGFGTVTSSKDSDCYKLGPSFFPPGTTDDSPYILSAHSFLENAVIYLAKDQNDTLGQTKFMFQQDLVTKLSYKDIKDKLVCVSASLYQTSYIFSVVREEDIEKQQKYNFIVNGMSLQGYLPANNVTTYKHMTLDVTSLHLNLNLKAISGNPVLYAYICMNYYDCHFDKGKVETMSKANSLYSSTSVNGDYHLTIPNEENSCIDKMKTGNREMCSTVAIVYCNSTVECQYTISMNTDKDVSLLKEKEKTSRFIDKKSYHYYSITNNNPNMQKLTVVLHSHTGDADLYGSRVNKFANEDEGALTSLSIGNRDSIEFVNTTDGNSTLVGKFYIAVKAFTPSYYTLYYYTSNNATQENTFKMLESGYIFSEHISKADGIKTYKFFNRDLNKLAPYMVSFNYLNCEGEAYLMKNEHSQETLLKLDNSYHHSQYLVKPSFDYYSSSNGYTFGFKVTSLDSTSTNENEMCLVYIGGIEKGREQVLNEGISQVYTTEVGEVMQYVYPHAFEDNAAILYLYFEQVANVTISYTVGATNSYAFLIKPKGILLDKQLLKNNCFSNLCNIHIKISSDSAITYKLLAKSSNNRPVYLKKGVVKHDSSSPSVYQYYYTDVSQYDSGEILLHLKHGNAKLVGKIVKKNSLPEGNADYGTIRLPKENEPNNLYYNPLTMSIRYNSTDTKQCYQGCQIFFGVYSNDQQAYSDTLSDYTVTVNSDDRPTLLPINYNIYGKINNTDKFNLYSLKIWEDADEVTFTVDCLESDCNLRINFGERIPTDTDFNWGYSFKADSKNNTVKLNIHDNILKQNSIRNLKNTVFTISIGRANTKSIQYHLYATVHSIGENPVYVITPGTSQLCTVNDNDYCDFMVHFADSKSHKIAFYANIVSGFRWRDHHVEFLALSLSPAEYIKFKNGQIARPRKEDYSNKHIIRSDGLDGNNIFTYTTPSTESVLILSLRFAQKATFTLISNLYTDEQTSLNNPKLSMDYLVFLPAGHNLKLHLAPKGGNYMVKMNRILGVGHINYLNDRSDKYSLVLERNSTTNQISIEEDDTTLEMLNRDTSQDFVCVFRYDTNMKHNFDEIHMGPQQTIFYPHNKGGFPLVYYLNLKNITTDITINIKLKDIQYEGDSDNTEDPFLDYEIFSNLVETKELNEKINSNAQLLLYVHGSHMGQYDNTLKMGRVTIPVQAGSTPLSAVVYIKQGPHNTRHEKSFTTSILAFPENSMHYNITLPQKTYFYSLVDTNKTSEGGNKQIGHVYKLKKEFMNENFMLIELASCDAEMDYALNDVDFSQEISIDRNPNLLVNRTQHRHVSYDHFGKRLIEVHLAQNSRKDLVLSIFPKSYNLQTVCENDMCRIDTMIGYAIRYRSFKSQKDFQRYNLNDKGLVSTEVVDENLVLNFGQVSNTNIYTTINARYYVRLFYPSLYDHRINMFDSICFARSTAKVYLFKEHPSANMPFRISEFPHNVNFVVSVLAETLDEGENHSSLLVYTPTMTILRTESSSWLILLFIIVLIVLITLLFLVYKKYRQTKVKLDYEVNDIRNMAAIPKAASIISEMKTVARNEKYTSLNETS